jgi:polyhydroxyalkanoate synthase
MRVPSIDTLVDAGANAFDMFLGDGVVDMSEVPRSIVDEGPQRTLYRYHAPGGRRARGAPVLLVPPLAAPATCFDLRRGCSVVEHLTQIGYPTYLVDYGPISFSERELGLEHWVDGVIPAAVEATSRDAGGEAVHVVGWCLGGIMALLAVAYERRLPVRSVAMVASPFNFAQVRMLTPVRRLAELTGGALGTALYRMLGGAPATLVSVGFRLTAIDRLVTKPVAVATHLHDRDWLAHMEAVDRYMANMLAYPGRTFGQLYHRFFRVNELAGGRLELEDGLAIDLADVRVPVLAVAGEADVLAPPAAVDHVAGLLPNAPEVRTATAPGGHLGVLTGRSAKRTTWRHLDDFLRRHDARPAAPARRRRTAAPAAA